MIEPGPWRIANPAYEAMAELPATCPSDEGFVYVIEFSFGTIKVGQTRNARMRMRQHFKDALKFGGGIRNMWVSDSHPEWGENELALIRACAAATDAVGGVEYFPGLDYESVIEFAQQLPMRSTPASMFPESDMDSFDDWCRSEGALSYVLSRVETYA